MAAGLHFEDFASGQVRDMGHHRFAQDEMIEFARRYDPQTFHIDPEAARGTPFGSLIASGWMTCGVMMRKMVDAYLGESACAGSPGLDAVRWLRPVRADDEISFRSVVLETRLSRSRRGFGLVKFRWEGLDAAARPVLEVEGWQLFRCRAA